MLLLEFGFHLYYNSSKAVLLKNQVEPVIGFTYTQVEQPYVSLAMPPSYQAVRAMFSFTMAIQAR